MFGTEGDRDIHPRRDLAEQAIGKIAEPLGLSLEDAALGVVEIVNAKMANVLERVVVGRGFDPRDFSILSYGGSGPLHAAGYAGELGINRVVIPGEVASVWSAFGIALSDIRYQLERDTQISSPFDAAELERVYAGLEEDLRRQVAASRVEDNDPELVRYARIRYEWQRHELEIRVPSKLDAGAVAEVGDRFVAMYESALRVGGAAARSAAGDRVRARAGLRGHRRAVDLARGPVRRTATVRAPARASSTSQRGEGGVETPVYDGTALKPGEVLTGPAIVDLPTTGIVVPPGARLRARPGRRLHPDLRRLSMATLDRTTMSEAEHRAFWDGKQHSYIPIGDLQVPEGLELWTDAKQDVDPITFEVLRHNLWNANEEHGSIVANLAVSPIAMETRDFQTAIITNDGEILFFGPYLQYLAGFMDMVVKYIIEQRGADIRPGDMWLVQRPVDRHRPSARRRTCSARCSWTASSSAGWPTTSTRTTSVAPSRAHSAPTPRTSTSTRS